MLAAHPFGKKYVFEDSYKEFLMQVQYYNIEKKYKTFSRLLADVPQSEKLRFLVGIAASGYIEQLHNKIPDVKNTLGKTFLPFHLHRFEIIESNINDRNQHRIAIIFYSEPLYWLNTIGEHLLVSLNTKPDVATGAIATDLIKLQPFMGIHSLKTVNDVTPVFGNNLLS